MKIVNPRDSDPFPYDAPDDNCNLQKPIAPVACSLDRRRFLQIAAGTLGVAILAGCEGSNNPAATPILTATAVGDEWKISDAAALKPGEAIAFEWPDKTPGLVFVTQKEEKLSAVSAKCTHAGCTVVWKEKGEFDCPCHGSRFDTSGKVLVGPATAPLPTFAARKKGSDVIIRSQK